MKGKALIAIFILAQFAGQAFGQFGSGIVFDPTQSGHAIEQIRQAQQLYTNALQTRDSVITIYNLARQMASLPSALYQHYVTPWTAWDNVYAGDTYGNVEAWINAANTGNGVNIGYTQASVNPPSRYPFYGNLSPQSQQLIAAQGATSDLNDGITESSLQTLGTMRARSEAREADIRQMEASTYSSDPSEHTDMATLQRINQATLTQLRAQQDANQIQQALALQQIVAQKQQQDALKATFADAALYQQQYSLTVVPLTSGYGNSMLQAH